MNITVNGIVYEVIDAKEKITIADSFVVRQNKIGTGNGEAKLYIGQENPDTRGFFGAIIPFQLNCFLLKSDLIKYLNETKPEYLNPEQPYQNREDLPALWNERLAFIEGLPDVIEFSASEQAQIVGNRVYINSADRNYNLLRELSLPNITYISILKLKSLADNKVFFYFRLFADYFGEEEHPAIIQAAEHHIESIPNSVERETQIRARIGQGKYRIELLKECPFCPITMISDDRLLIASHIKPWAHSNDTEKIDPKNGFMFTPTFDYLFDRGFISFTNDKKIILSPFLSNMTYSKLGLSPNKEYNLLSIDGREAYLEYHRNEILKGV